jgi:hypothetical protein
MKIILFHTVVALMKKYRRHQTILDGEPAAPPTEIRNEIIKLYLLQRHKLVPVSPHHPGYICKYPSSQLIC